jgi:hypothetical protein
VCIGHQRFVPEALQQAVDPVGVRAGFEHHPHPGPGAEVFFQRRTAGADLSAFDDAPVEIDQADMAVLVAQIETRHHVHALLDHLSFPRVRESFAMFLHGSPFSFRSTEGWGSPCGSKARVKPVTGSLPPDGEPPHVISARGWLPGWGDTHR